ncbi:MAG: hypothetical protein ABTQ34_05215 [Bdellovibrionales bacterium]
MLKENENGMPAFAGMTLVSIEKFSSDSVVTPAKAGVPFGYCAFLMSFSADC